MRAPQGDRPGRYREQGVDELCRSHRIRNLFGDEIRVGGWLSWIGLRCSDNEVREWIKRSGSEI